MIKATTLTWIFVGIVILLIIGFFAGWYGPKFSYKRGRSFANSNNGNSYAVGGIIGGTVTGGNVFPGHAIINPTIINPSIINPTLTCEAIKDRVNFIRNNYSGQNIYSFQSELENLKAQFLNMNCGSTTRSSNSACEAWLYCPSGCHQLWIDCFGAKG